MRLPSGNSTSSTCGLTLCHLKVLAGRDLDLGVEVADVADDGAVLHRPHVVEGDDVDVAGRGDEDVGAGRRVLHGHDLIAFHRRLQRADRIDLGDHDAAAGIAQRGGRALADVAEARDHRDLAGHHHVGAAADAVDQRFAAAIEVVELRLGDRVVDVDGREQELALLVHVVEAVHARGGLFGDALDAWRRSAYQPGLAFMRFLIEREEDFLLLVGRVVEEAPCRPLRRACRDGPAGWRRRRRRGSCSACRRRAHSKILWV